MKKQTKSWVLVNLFTRECALDVLISRNCENRGQMIAELVFIRKLSSLCVCAVMLWLQTKRSSSVDS